LHFTTEILAKLREQGVVRVEITLHIGLGTFQPVEVEQVEEHRLHREWFEIAPEAAEKLNTAQRIVAAGTTSVRTLEQATAAGGSFHAGSGDTDLFIYPGFRFRAVNALLTNFHLPRSSLLMLVCAFAGRDLVLEAYQHAIREEYRFYSYGDCMLLV
jgi:S-adenosylmethionine:tRNA ribosyltransferase-isomerase